MTDRPRRLCAIPGDRLGNALVVFMDMNKPHGYHGGLFADLFVPDINLG